MRRRTAQVEILNRRAEHRPARHRTQKEQLLQRELTLENIALAQSPFPFQIERRDHLAMQNDVLDIRRVLGNGVDDGVAELFFLRIPVQSWRSLYGAYCTKHDITCFPGGATEGSVSDGITMSI